MSPIPSNPLLRFATILALAFACSGCRKRDPSKPESGEPPGNVSRAETGKTDAGTTNKDPISVPERVDDFKIPGNGPTHHIFVIDNSYSMGCRRNQLSSLDKACQAADRLVSKIKPFEEDLFTLVLMSEYPECPLRGRTRPQLESFRRALGEIQVTHYRGNMARTIQEIQKALDNPAAAKLDHHVYLLTDLERDSWRCADERQAQAFNDALRILSLRDRTSFFLMDCGTPGAVNRAIVDLRAPEAIPTTKKPTEFAVDVRNFSNTSFAETRVKLYMDGNFYMQKTVPLQAGALVTVTFRYDFQGSGPHIVEAALEPDSLEIDDRRWLALDVKDSLKGLLIDGKPEKKRWLTATGVLSLALDPFGDGRGGFSTEVRPWDDFNAENLDDYDFVVMADVKGVDPKKIEKIEGFVARGGGLFITLGDEVRPGPFNESFFKGGDGLSPAALVEVLGQAPSEAHPSGVRRHIQSFNSDHPAFRSLRAELQSAVSGLVFFKYMKVEGCKPENVIAYFDDGNKAPLMLEKSYKEGKVFLLTSTLNGDWNDGVPGKPVYVPLCIDLCGALARRPSRRNFVIGEVMRITLPVEMSRNDFRLERPEGGAVTLIPLARDTKLFDLQYPAQTLDNPDPLVNSGLIRIGKYTLSVPGERDFRFSPVAYFACNLTPRATDGNFDRISPDEIQRLFPDFRVTFLTIATKDDDRIDPTRSDTAMPPSLEEIRIWYEYPKYLHLKDTPENQPILLGNVTAPERTHVRFIAVFDEDLQDGATMTVGVMDKAKTLPLKILLDEKGRRRWVSGEFDVRDEYSEWGLNLTAQNGLQNRDRIRYTIRGKKHQPPIFREVDPFSEEDVSEVCLKPLEGEWEDEYGIAETSIEYRILGTGRSTDWEVVKLGRDHLGGKEYGALKLHVLYDLDLAKLKVVPGDFVEIRFIASDFKDFEPLNISKSRVFVLRVKAAREIDAALQHAIEHVKQSLEKQHRYEETVRRKTEGVQKKLGSLDTLSDEQKAEVRMAALDQNEVLHKLDTARKDLTRIVRRGVQNRIYDERATAKLNTAIKALAILVGETGNDPRPGAAASARDHLADGAASGTAKGRSEHFRESLLRQDETIEGIKMAMNALP